MLNYILVSAGAAIGGALRFGISSYIQKNISVIFPYGTLVVNVIGSFILGIIMFYLNEKELIGSEFRLFLTVGFCGGFTTFSTFSYETLALFRDSEIGLALYNVMLNVILCLAGIYIAYLISKIIGWFMQTNSEAKLLRIFVGESDRINGKPVYETLVLKAREAGLAGATVIKGIMGFGANSKIHTSKLLTLSEDLPLIIEIVDTLEKIEKFIPTINIIFENANIGGLVTIEKAQIIKYISTKK